MAEVLEVNLLDRRLLREGSSQEVYYVSCTPVHLPRCQHRTSSRTGMGAFGRSSEQVWFNVNYLDARAPLQPNTATALPFNGRIKFDTIEGSMCIWMWTLASMHAKDSCEDMFCG